MKKLTKRVRRKMKHRRQYPTIRKGGYVGWYSKVHAGKNGTIIWERHDGREVEVTQVTSTWVRPRGFEDYRCLGFVKECVRPGRTGSVQYLKFIDRRDGYRWKEISEQSVAEVLGFTEKIRLSKFSRSIIPVLTDGVP